MLQHSEQGANWLYGEDSDFVAKHEVAHTVPRPNAKRPSYRFGERSLPF